MCFFGWTDPLPAARFAPFPASCESCPKTCKYTGFPDSFQPSVPFRLPEASGPVCRSAPAPADRFSPSEASALGGVNADDSDPVPVLYQSGYLTIQSYDERWQSYTLKYPNKEVERGFMECLAKQSKRRLKPM